MRSRSLLTILTVAVCSLALEPLASAEGSQQRPRIRDWHLGVEALTDFPIQVGGQVTLEMPHGVRLSGSAGAFIEPYSELVNDAIVSFGGYNQRVADLISASLDDSLVWNIHLGWRPFKRAGFYLAGGYRQVALSGHVNPAEVVEIATGRTLAQKDRKLLDASYEVSSTLHMVDVELGWELVFVRHLTVRLALGAALTVRANSELPQVSLDVADQLEPYIDQQYIDMSVDVARRVAGDYLDSTYEQYVFSPTISLALGYRFF